mgnify:CR=1 FL=1
MTAAADCVRALASGGGNRQSVGSVSSSGGGTGGGGGAGGGSSTVTGVKRPAGSLGLARRSLPAPGAAGCTAIMKPYKVRCTGFV